MNGRSWMTCLLTILVAFTGGYLAAHHSAPRSASGADSAVRQIACYFSPNGGCENVITSQIAGARNSVEVQTHAFTSGSIADALIDASKRGVQVTVVLDAAFTSEHREQARRLTRAGIPVYLDAQHALADSRAILIDERVILTGFELSHAAEHENAETLLLIRDRPDLQSAFENNFHSHLIHSQKYAGN